MGADIVRKLKRKCHIKLRVLREKPRFVLCYVMDALFTWVLGLIVSIIGLVLFPALAPSGPLSGARPDFLNADKAGQLAANVIEKMRHFSEPGLIGIITAIPSDLKRLGVKLCEFVRRWWEFLGQLAALLLAPRMLWERLRDFWARYEAKIKIVATKALGIAISFVLFRLLIYAAPRLGAGLLTIWGINAGVLVLQWCAALIAPPMARVIRRKLGNLWVTKERRKLHDKGATLLGNVRSAMDAKSESVEEEDRSVMGGMEHEKESQDPGRSLGAA